MKKKSKAKTIRERIDEANSLAENGKIDKAIELLADLLREKYGKPTIEETIELVNAVDSLKKQRKGDENKK